MTLCPSSNELCHTLCPTLCDPDAETRSGHLFHVFFRTGLTHSSRPFPRLFYSLTHPFVPATTTNKLRAFPSFILPHRVFLPLLSCYHITLIFLASSSTHPILSISKAILTRQLIELCQVSPPPRVQKGPRLLVPYYFVFLPSVSIVAGHFPILS